MKSRKRFKKIISKLVYKSMNPSYNKKPEEYITSEFKKEGFLKRKKINEKA